MKKSIKYKYEIENINKTKSLFFEIPIKLINNQKSIKKIKMTQISNTKYKKRDTDKFNIK